MRCAVLPCVYDAGRLPRTGCGVILEKTKITAGRRSMARKLAVLFDGTSNTTQGRTNVVRLCKLIATLPSISYFT